MKEEIHQAAYDLPAQVEGGDRTVVGVNAFKEEGGSAPHPSSPTIRPWKKPRRGAWRS